MNSLDFEYDDRCDVSHLEGILWFTDSTYAVREFYDGQEQWLLISKPKIPKRGKFVENIWKYSVGGG